MSVFVLILGLSLALAILYLIRAYVEKRIIRLEQEYAAIVREVRQNEREIVRLTRKAETLTRKVRR